MIVKERIRAIRLMSAISRQPDYARQIGVKISIGDLTASQKTERREKKNK